jgi:hypothetical protein
MSRGATVAGFVRFVAHHVTQNQRGLLQPRRLAQRREVGREVEIAISSSQFAKLYPRTGSSSMSVVRR